MYTKWEKSSSKLPHEIITLGEGIEEIQSFVRFSHLRRKAAEESRLRIRNARGACEARKVTTAPLVARSSIWRGTEGHSAVCVRTASPRARRCFAAPCHRFSLPPHGTSAIVEIKTNIQIASEKLGRNFRRPPFAEQRNSRGHRHPLDSPVWQGVSRLDSTILCSRPTENPW